MIRVHLRLPDPPDEARLGHCVRCARPLQDVRVSHLERGTLFVDVPAWHCSHCDETYFHVGTINLIDSHLATHALDDRALLPHV